MNQRTAVLITCHNRCDKTIACLDALFKSKLNPQFLFEVFLVDDGSIDGTDILVKKHFASVNVINGNGKLYWNRGMLLAWETAVKAQDFDFFLWLNDDTILHYNAFNLMLSQALIWDKKRIIVGTTCSVHSGKFTYGGYRFYNDELIPNGTWQDCDYFNGNIVLIPNFIFQKVGFLDKRFRHALGDFDFGMRARKLGYVHLSSPEYFGICERHEKEPQWRNPDLSLKKRFKNLYSPLGKNPMEAFISDHRHHGILNAIYHFITLHIRVLVPQLWTFFEKKKKKINSAYSFN